MMPHGIQIMTASTLSLNVTGLLRVNKTYYIAEKAIREILTSRGIAGVGFVDGGSYE